MLQHFRLYATMAVIVGAILFCGDIGIAEWTEPVCLSELNNFETGRTGTQPCISSDGLSIFYVSLVYELGPGDPYYILEARRDNPGEPFGSEKVLTELGNAGSHMDDPWVSSDGLRLYYGQAIHDGVDWVLVLKMAFRNTVSDGWQEGRVFSEFHIPGSSDAHCTLTSDELTILWMSRRSSKYDPYRIFTATRESINSPFSAAVEVTELSSANADGPHLSGDGLRVYFRATRPDNGALNIYMMTRPSLSEPFGNMEHLEGVTGPDAGGGYPYLSPDEKTIYFSGRRGDTLYERGTWVSYWIDDPYVVAVESIAAAIAAKEEAIAVITSGLDKERAALEALNELRATGEVDRVNIRKTKTQIFHAIKRQTRAIAELEKSIRDLEKALEELEPEGTDTPAEGD